MLAPPAPSLRFGPSPQFPNLPVGQRSTEQLVVLRNSGLAPVNIQSIQLTGDGAADFAPATDNCAPRLLPAGQDCAVALTFIPHSVGRRTAKLTVVSEKGIFPGALAIVGVATASTDFHANPPNIDFGDQAVGVADDWRSAEIDGIGNSPLQVLSAKIVGDSADDFQLGTNTCSDLSPDATQCSINVRFTPAVAGDRTARLELEGSAGNAAHEITLSGRGAAPDILLDPEIVSFPATQVGQRAETESITVHSSGTAEVHIGNVVLDGGSPSDFAVVNNSCANTTMQPGASCVLGVQFIPATVGSRTGMLSVSDNASDGPHVIQLQGTATARPMPSAQIYAKTNSFGSQAVGTKAIPISILVTSRGLVPLTIGTIAVSGPPSVFPMKTNCSGRVLQPKQQCEVDVYFIPASSGNYQTSVAIPHDATDAPRTFALTGEGVAPALGWCCAGGKFFPADANNCKQPEGRLYPDEVAARIACAPPPKKQPQTPPAKQPGGPGYDGTVQTPPPTPTGLAPGTTAPSQTVTCTSLLLHWEGSAASAGYLLSVSRSVPAAVAYVPPMPVLKDTRATGPRYQFPSTLEAGSYFWTVTAVNASGQKSPPAPARYFTCTPKPNPPKNIKEISHVLVKPKPASTPVIQ